MRVLWSDGCSIEKGKGQQPEFVFRRAGGVLQKWAVQPKSVKCKTDNMFWVIFGWGVLSHLVAMDGDPDSKERVVTAGLY
jgi:hypothetical protein